MRLVNKVATQRCCTLFVTESSRLSVATSKALLQTRVSEAALSSARLHARVASCLHGVSRPSSCCQANVGRFWRRSQRSSGQRASCHVHRTLLHRRNVIMCSVRGRWPPQAGRVKIIDFSKTTLLSCSQRADHGTLRGSASFALVHEKVWSKVNCFACDCVLELVVCRVRFARVSCPWLRFEVSLIPRHDTDAS